MSSEDDRFGEAIYHARMTGRLPGTLPGEDELPNVAHASEVQAACTGRDPALVTGGPVVDVAAPRAERHATMRAAGWGGPDAPQSTPATLGGVVLTEERVREWDLLLTAARRAGVTPQQAVREAGAALRGGR